MFSRLYSLAIDIVGLVILFWFGFDAITGSGSTRDLIVAGIVSIMVVIDTAADRIIKEIKEA